ncbi:hypothetical protein B0I35DRAFT_115196 [Stachybotrys elegans]|uniref:Fungal N-terminal domain-containing protein n=1 Tax=Stachybotrys elegans TaxID=80388 RepID=A0A8K0SWX2_9HYPO|nr:hypothetical protein B0I35DRAFT_115196 [Stachybotrys elegans]
MSGAETIVGIVGSGAGLLSLSIQLGESVMKLKRIYDAAKELPKNISKIILGLETIQIALQMLEQQRQQSGHSGVLLVRCILQCQQSSDEIQQLVDELQAKLSKHKKFGRMLNTFLRNPKVQDLLDKLATAMNSLEFAYMIYLVDQQSRLNQAQAQYSASQGAQLQSLQNQVAQMDANIIREITLLKEQSNTKHILPAHRALGTRNTCSKINAVSTINNSKELELDHEKNHPWSSDSPKSKRKEMKFRVQLRLPSWICSSIWNLAIIRSQNSWCLNMQSYNMVPADSKIFYHCRRGNLGEIRRMFMSGEASPLDVAQISGCTLPTPRNLSVSSLPNGSTRHGHNPICRSSCLWALQRDGYRTRVLRPDHTAKRILYRFRICP